MLQNKNILIIDDHTLFREGLKAILGRDSRFKVVGEAGSAREGLGLARKLKPDVVLVDISLPDRSGIQLTSEIRTLLPESQIMIVSMHSKIDAVGKGEYFLDSSVSHEVVKKLMKFPLKEAKITDAAYGTLTPREQEVMRLLAEGLSTKEVAEKLFISPKTVENHRANIMKKLDLHSSLELFRFAARIGLLDVQLWMA
jgi:DNA-binding NarL/FixJ family response regulator